MLVTLLATVERRSPPCHSIYCTHAKDRYGGETTPFVVATRPLRPISPDTVGQSTPNGTWEAKEKAMLTGGQPYSAMA
jgi:hypothetical protein